MNAHTDTTERRPMPPAIDDIYGEVSAIDHLMHFLISDLEFELDVKRGKQTGIGEITFRFRQENIEATLWLAAEVAIRAANLRESICNLPTALDADEVMP